MPVGPVRFCCAAMTETLPFISADLGQSSAGFAITSKSQTFLFHGHQVFGDGNDQPCHIELTKATDFCIRARDITVCLVMDTSTYLNFN